MSSRLYLQALPGETRAFLYRDETLQDLAIERPGQGPRAGDRFLGRVTRLERRLAGAFVTLGEGPEGLLPLAEAPAGLSEGQFLAVRVVRAAVEGKGPRLAPLDASPKTPAEGAAPRCLGRGLGAVERLLSGAEAIECDEAETLGALQRRGLPAKLALGGFPPALCHRFDAAVEALLQPAVTLPEGGSLLIEPGRTLTAVDVNLGRREGAGAALAVNLAAAAEIPRQLRLRGQGGRVVIDFLALQPPEQRQAVERALRAALKEDPEPVKLIGWSRGGLYELTRRRSGASLRDLLLEPAGDYGGWRKRAETLAFEGLRALLLAARAAPGGRFALHLRADAARWLAGQPALAAAAERLGRPPAVLEADLPAYEVKQS